MAPKTVTSSKIETVLSRFLNVKNVSAEQVWTPREFQTVGAAAQNALTVNDIVAGCC